MSKRNYWQSHIVYSRNHTANNNFAVSRLKVELQLLCHCAIDAWATGCAECQCYLVIMFLLLALFTIVMQMPTSLFKCRYLFQKLTCLLHVKTCIFIFLDVIY